MTNQKIIVVNNRTAQKAKSAVGTACSGAVGSSHLDYGSGGHLFAGASGSAVISALRGDIYYAQSVPMMPCWRVCVLET